jgi:type I restriction enzyme S subunit
VKQVALLKEARKGLAPEAERLLAKFDVVAEAPGGVKRLRELILELAVRGRLVPQYPTDAPASELLKEIKDVKTRHGTVGRRRAALDEEYVSSAPYEAPAQWEWCQLDDVALRVQYGTSERPYEQAVGLPILRMNNIRDGRLTLENLKYVSRDSEGISDLLLSEGDILFNRTNSYELVGKAAVFFEAPQVAGGCTFASYLIRVSLVKEFLLPNFINIFFATSVFRKTQIEPGITQQTGQANFSGGKLRNVWIPLPPLADQKRIVAKVDELMKLCDDLEARQTKQRGTAGRLNKAALDALTSAEGPEELAASWRRVAGSFDALLNRPESVEELRASVLGLAVRGRLVSQNPKEGTAVTLVAQLADAKTALPSKWPVKVDAPLPPVQDSDAPYPVPASWRWVRLGDCGVFMGGGTPSKSNPSFWAGPIPWVSPKDMKRPYIDDAEDHISDAAVRNSAVKLIPKGALLFVVRGMILAHSFPTALTTREVTINQDMKALLLALPALDEYLLRTCQSARRRMLERVEHSSHGTCRLASEDVEQFPIPLPPLAEQKRIVAKVDELMKLCDALTEALRRAEDTAKNLADALVAELLA